MPLYEFECLKCGEKFEAVLPFSASGALQACPKCGLEVKKSPPTGTLHRWQNCVPPTHKWYKPEDYGRA